MGQEHMEFLASHFGHGLLPPFSFQYGGEASADFIRNWDFHIGAPRTNDRRSTTTYSYRDTVTGLEMQCDTEVFSDFPAVEWVVRFTNRGSDDSALIENVLSLDSRLPCGDAAVPVLHRALGSAASRQDFAPVDDSLVPDSRVSFSTIGGRSSNTTAFPFFNVEQRAEPESCGACGAGGGDAAGARQTGGVEGAAGRSRGVIVGVGWSGQWGASVVRDPDGSLVIQAGLEGTHLKLHPGERIRTARILLFFYDAEDLVDSQNQFRRFILAHHTQRRDGKPVLAPLASMERLYGGEEANRDTEENQIAYARRIAPCGVECLWIDAGWFEGLWPNGVGNWFVREEGFPNGLRPISDAASALGMGFVIWFEPERVHQGTWLDREHPDWVLRLPDNPNGLLDLGNPEALRWLTDHISGMIAREGISVYRQDFNMEPLPYWRAVDAPDRQGMSEIRHVEGLYKFWDELLARHPGLIIDNCASGGRRIDLETISRSIPLWRTDYNYGEPNGQQSHTHALSRHLPTSSTGCVNLNPYSFRSAMNSGVCVLCARPWSDSDFDTLKRLADEFKMVRELYHGDFYPLTVHSVKDDVWIAYQFHRADQRRGMVLAFRRPESPYPCAILKLRGLEAEKDYELTCMDAGDVRHVRGADLLAGLKVSIDEAPGSALMTYRY